MKIIKKKRLTLLQKRAITGFLFISPWFLGFLIYYVRSLFLTVNFALSKVSLAESGGYSVSFVGVDNFKYALFEHGTFNKIFVNSIADILIDVPCIIFFSLFMSMLINGKFKGRYIIRAILFLPIIFGAGAISDSLDLATQAIQGGVSSMAADTASGSTGINIEYFFDLLIQFGLPIGLLDYIIGMVAKIFEIVRASGVQIIIFLAALQAVPGTLYEVSKIEGATAYETFWKVTFPMVSPLILTNVVYTIVDSFVTSKVVDMAYTTAFTNFNYGLSSAMSILSCFVVCIILIIVGKLISKKTFYYN